MTETNEQKLSKLSKRFGAQDATTSDANWTPIDFGFLSDTRAARTAGPSWKSGMGAGA